MNQGKFIQCFLSYENSDCQEDDKNLLKKISDIINHANKIGQIEIIIEDNQYYIKCFVIGAILLFIFYKFFTILERI